METQTMLWKDGNRRTVCENKCLNCGATFLVPVTVMKRGRGKYCSVRCHNSANAKAIPPEKRRGANNPNWKGGRSASHFARIFEQRHAEKYRAQCLVRAAIRRGDLVRGNCEVCGIGSDVQGHHDDYSKPLDVRWLCGKHHRIAHGKTA